MDKLNDLLQSIADFFSLPIIGNEKFTPGNILFALLIFFLARYVIRLVGRILEKSVIARRIPIDTGRRKAVLQIFSYFIYLITVLLILNTFGIDLTILVTSTAALFVGVGLALQHISSDIVSGIIILFDGTVEVGDVIEVNSLDLTGKVIEIGLRTSVIETQDSVNIIIPNSKLTSSSVINHNYQDNKTRYSLMVGVAYGSDMKLVKKLLMEAAEEHERVLSYPSPHVRFTNFGDSSLEMQLLFWTTYNFEVEDTKSEIRFSIDEKFRAQGVKIPFPQRDLHLVSDTRNNS